MIPYIFTGELDPEALEDVGSVVLQDSGSNDLYALGNWAAIRSYASHGLGALSDCTSCEVTEERNGEYELELEYPVEGRHFDKIETRAIIIAKPNATDNPQPFRIYRVDAEIDGVVTVYAQHLSYDLSGVPVGPIKATSCSDACTKLKQSAIISTPFTISTTVATVADWETEVPASLRSWFGGKEGSLLDVYGGEWHYNGYTCTLESARGQDRGVVIRYGKNLIDLEQEKNISEVWTGILPYWQDYESGNTVSAPILNASGTFDFRRILCLDLSDDFEEQPTTAQLTSRARTYMTQNNIGAPKVNLSIDWAQSTDTVDLCDTVTVRFEKMGISVKAKCVKTVWDVLLDRYSKIEIGDAKTSITQTIAGLEVEDKVVKSSISGNMLRAISNATKLITGNSGGYVVMRDSDGNGSPDEILVMDTPDVNTCTKCWRWNRSGFGFSSSGYNGTYGLAITMDGAIVADYITTGSLSADRISGGTIDATDVTITNLDADNITTGTMSANHISGGTLILGGSGNGNGTASIKDSNGDTAVTINNTGIAINRTVTFLKSNYNASDTTTCQNIILGTITPTVTQLNKYDIDGDGIISAADLLKVQKLATDAVDSYTLTAKINLGSTSTATALGTDGVAIRTNGMYAASASIANLEVNSISGHDTFVTIAGIPMSMETYNYTSSSGSTLRILSTGAFARYVSSSKRYKHDITEELDEDPEKLYELKVKQFKYNEDYLSKDDQRSGKNVLGFIAEEVAEVMPGAVDYDNGGIPEMWNVHVIVPAMLKLIQNQKNEIDELRARLERLEARFIDDGR